MARHAPYLIVGGGMTGDAAARGIRQIDPQGEIVLIGRESDPPYNRPPLSKGLWKGAPMSRVWRRTETLGVNLQLGRSAAVFDARNKTVVDDRGDAWTFDRLLLATGGDPIRLGTDGGERVIYYRTLADYQRLRALCETSQRFAVIGGGFIGSEIASVLASLGKTVHMLFPEAGIGARVLPDALSRHLNSVFEARGVRVQAGRLVRALEHGEQAVTVLLDNGECVEADAVVAGLGIRPNTHLAEAAGLKTGNGIEVDAFHRTSHPDIFAAGDVASFYNPLLGRRMRVEHEENANMGGMLAGLGMAGQPAPYDHLPAVYSTLFDVRYDAVGDLDPALEIVYDWQAPLEKGVAYYLLAGRVRGVLLWNVSRGLDVARQLIAAPGPFRAADLRGRIPG